jgi:serine O-acetyltransferase
VTALAAGLANIHRNLDADVSATYRVDPAAASVDEGMLSYPSVIAIIYHRVAHRGAFDFRDRARTYGH